MSEKVLQIITAETGWRHVYAYLGVSGDLATLPDDHLFGVAPIACWALTESENEQWRAVQHVAPRDWPQYLAVHDDNERGSIGYLAPGEQPDSNYRDEAIDQITFYREQQARRAEK